ncbi:MAG: AAC(3) family N-acetyltransferase [Planctomycetes bacterium]|nr:AAC(3) family N-acetyltransferase [Planctomycetota bacterium]
MATARPPAPTTRTTTGTNAPGNGAGVLSQPAFLSRDPLPVTAGRIQRDLLALGLPPGALLILHSSLSSLGCVPGGPQGVLDGLLATLGPEGTLVVPTHSSENSDPSAWENPPVPAEWWDSIRAEMPAFDPARTPTRGMGSIPELFRTWPGVLRSQHPTCSFAARGPLAARITSEHALARPLGEDGPLARLYEQDAWVLLLGVGHGSNTSLHLAEHRSAQPTFEQQGSAVQTPAGRAWVRYEVLAGEEERFPALGEAFEASHGVALGRVGAAETRLFRQRALVDFGVEWLSARDSPRPSEN